MVNLFLCEFWLVICFCLVVSVKVIFFVWFVFFLNSCRSWLVMSGSVIILICLVQVKKILVVLLWRLFRMRWKILFVVCVWLNSLVLVFCWIVGLNICWLGKCVRFCCVRFWWLICNCWFLMNFLMVLMLIFVSSWLFCWLICIVLVLFWCWCLIVLMRFWSLCNLLVCWLIVFLVRLVRSFFCCSRCWLFSWCIVKNWMVLFCWSWMFYWFVMCW